MAHKFRIHKSDDLDGSVKGAWRPALVATVYGTDGMPLAWKEIVVFTCPGCGCPQGVGDDDAQIVDGKTDRAVKCNDPRCSWSEVLEFDLHQDAVGRERFGKLKKKAEDEVVEARVAHVRDVILENDRKEQQARVDAAARKVMAAGGNPADVFNAFMKASKSK